MKKLFIIPLALLLITAFTGNSGSAVKSKPKVQLDTVNHKPEVSIELEKLDKALAQLEKTL